MTPSGLMPKAMVAKATVPSGAPAQPAGSWQVKSRVMGFELIRVLHEPVTFAASSPVSRYVPTNCWRGLMSQIAVSGGTLVGSGGTDVAS